MSKSIVVILLVLGLAGYAQAIVFDFQGHPDTHPGDDAPGATIITPATPLYSAAQGYGLATSADGGRNRGGTDLLLKDFIFDDVDQLIFRVDLPNGEYNVQSWSGDMGFARGSLRMIISLDGGVTETFLYGSDGTSPGNSPLPGTFMTTFVDSGTPGVYDQIIPDDKQALGANYRMEAREFLQVIDVIEVINSSLTFMVGSGDRTINAIEITAIPEPATMILLGLGGLLIRRKK